MFKRLFSAALVFGAAALAPPVLAMTCASRAVVTENLQTRYAETLTAGGLQAARPVKTMIEIWSSDHTGTFTILVTNPVGVSCVISSGDHFFLTNPNQVPAATISPDGSG